ncbi:hypothetical protein BDA96_02G070900 [Sorghum bicolor]|uniref:Uncharacterized protein n=2 Tax=Sorghum bicolor TaxID=4558 RepID=A0A1B6Q9P1_SORBI|nr:hypothetical protein BDA96_02G070900 [Sorghum bicolor]KXG34622.1 hypothetical protein SORBI_3002G069500 [Sorghum bicolor]KXG34623.1 hypothetical protein SORBI_3002G069500 [Sorghum bicolor]KXG34624.1 hypothetical protein SORBI_3002G069500 [Sorghum bicolor]
MPILGNYTGTIGKNERLGLSSMQLNSFTAEEACLFVPLPFSSTQQPAAATTTPSEEKKSRRLVVRRRPGRVLRAGHGGIVVPPRSLQQQRLRWSHAALRPRPSTTTGHSASTRLTSAVEDKRYGEAPARAEVAGETAPACVIELPPSHLVDLRPQVAGASLPVL